MAVSKDTSKAELRESILERWGDGKKTTMRRPANMEDQLQLLLEALRAMKEGDFSARLKIDESGIMKEIAAAFNDVVDLEEKMASETTRLRDTVGQEGVLTERASLGRVSGMWAVKVDSLNSLINNMAQPATAVAQVITAVAQGDLSKKVPLQTDGNRLKGDFLRFGTTVNTMVDQLRSFSSEVTRVSGEVGTEGKLGGQAEVTDAAGVWKELTDNVNTFTRNLTEQVRDIAKVATAIADGDLSQKITVDARGEILQLKDTINSTVDRLRSFSSEVTRVAGEVGTEGKLGGQAEVRDVAGVWKELTDNVNSFARNLTVQVRDIAKIATAIADGDLSQKITVDAQGEILQLKNTINSTVDRLRSFSSEVTRVAGEVGTEGKLGGQAEVKDAAGIWKELTDNVNLFARNLTEQVRDIAKIATAIADGDLSQKITVDAQGEILQLKNTINATVDRLRSFSSEVTRVSREVGTEGKLGGQAEVKDVSGIWKELTDNVNMFTRNLTEQVRDIAKVAMAIARGDLSQKITVDAKGEIMELKDTINAMVDNLNSIIGDINGVMAMVSEGTLTRVIDVKAAGEFASMVNGINGMIESLRGIVTELTEAGVNIGAVSQNMLAAGQEMNAMVTQLSSSVAQIADGAQAQAQQIMEASKESEGVGVIASNTLNQVEQMSRSSEIANTASGEGSEAMGDTIKNTELMLEGSNNSVTSIESLSKSNEQIQEIVDVIRDIATQTNILAINAAIEAVRAGRQGKGFAVVAEEVKTLSADSKTQAKQISNLVQTVQKETNETVTTIKTMAENVRLGNVSIEQTSKAFTDIKSSIEGTSDITREISVAAAEQKKSIDAISESLDKISGIATDTSAISTQSADSAKNLLGRMQELTATATNLADMSNKFQQTVERFNLGEGAFQETKKPGRTRRAPGAATSRTRAAS